MGAWMDPNMGSYGVEPMSMSSWMTPGNSGAQVRPVVSLLLTTVLVDDGNAMMPAIAKMSVASVFCHW